MRIAINTRFLLPHKMEGFGWFTYETVRRIVLTHPEHHFIFFFDRPFDPKFIFADNVEGVVLRPQTRRPLLFRIWFNYSVTKALKKYKADIFFSPDGYLSLKTTIPQIGVIHDLNFEHFPEDLPAWARNYLKKYFPLFAKKASHIITVSEYSKLDIEQTYGIAPNKITVAHNGGSEVYQRLSIDEKSATRQNLTDGKEYFIYVGALHARKNVSRLLQAFDQFKSSTDSDTELVIVGEKLWADKSLESVYDKMLHSSAVRFTGHLDIDLLSKYVGSAKALVLVSYFEGFGIPLVEAMRCGIPVLSGDLTSLPEVTGNAGITVDPFSVDEISEGLKKLDSDETLCKKFGEIGLERSKQFTWDRSAEIIWSVLQKYL